ncbi:MAG: phosphatidylglycerol lysyltransferase domain-containing protein [Treponema sp.]|nr:phosphatidylglycerol lysyltransferase domain-containing protein [Treponema sp.]
MNETMPVPCYPDFAPLSMDMKNALHPRLALTADGVSEFTFSGLYLFRNRYNYLISRNGTNGGFIVSGEQPETGHGAAGKFFMTPCEAPDRDTLESLLNTRGYWKNIPETVIAKSGPQLEEWGIRASEDRDNFDYLHYRSDLAGLAGKKYHKKKNLVNQFLNAYSHEERPLTRELVPHAMEILEQWRRDKGEDGDFHEAKEALERFDALALRGFIYYAGGKAAAYSLGESIAKGRMFAIHFEKAVDQYRGIYQFMNQAFAAALPRFFTFINREQDLGDKGLRQAKMTYRPSGFVKKYTAGRPGEAQ